jgi:type II secretory pathway pseudopilin PulG
MKGLELPINILIIVVLAVIVLIAVIALFFPSFYSSSQTVSVESAKSSACQVLANLGCVSNTNSITISNFDADKDGSLDPGYTVGACQTTDANDNFYMLCQCYLNANEEQCKNTCGCGSTTSSSSPLPGELPPPPP